MVSSPRKTAVKMVEPQFSLLTCLFVGGCFLFLETLVDLICRPFEGHRSALYHLIIATNNHILDLMRLPHLYSYALEWWVPILLCCLALGYTLGWRGMMYSLCGLIVFLIIIHNFRGITMRHNVFESADDIRRFHSQGEALNIPDPLFWDMGYFVAAFLGSIAGWSLRTPFHKIGAARWNIGLTPTLWLGYACFVLGVLETVITILFVQPTDLYLNLPITHGYALMAFGLIMVIGVQYKERLSQYFNFEIV